MLPQRKIGTQCGDVLTQKDTNTHARTHIKKGLSDARDLMPESRGKSIADGESANSAVRWTDDPGDRALEGFL